MESISSRNNPKIKEVRLLRQAKIRRQSGSCLVEGIWHFIEAVEAWRSGAYVKLVSVFYAPELLKSDLALQVIEELSPSSVPCYPVTGPVFLSLADKENPQGVLAVVQPKSTALDQINPVTCPWLVGLVEPQDPGNIGTILRTIDAVGANGLLLIDGGADPYQSECIRASMGSIFWFPVIQTSFQALLTWVDANNYKLYGTSARGDKNFNEMDHYQTPSILLMGSERQGLTQPQRNACHELLRLPQVGRVSSLNLAVATGVMLYDMLRKFG